MPGGSVEFLFDLFRFFELTMVVVRRREVGLIPLLIWLLVVHPAIDSVLLLP